MSSSEANIPLAMITGGRVADQEFLPTELLFYRLEEFYEFGAQPSGVSVRMPDFSVNREKHGGLPEFVLVPDWGHLGIAQFAHSSIPVPIRSDGGVEFSWEAIHEPDERNFHHCTIYSVKHGVRCTKRSQINDLVAKQFRQRLSEVMKVVKSSREKT